MFSNVWPTTLRIVMAVIHRRRTVAKLLDESVAENSFLAR